MHLFHDRKYAYGNKQKYYVLKEKQNQIITVLRLRIPYRILNSDKCPMNFIHNFYNVGEMVISNIDFSFTNSNIFRNLRHIDVHFIFMNDMEKNRHVFTQISGGKSYHNSLYYSHLSELFFKNMITQK